MANRGSKHDKTGRTKGAKRPWESRHVEIFNGFRQEPAWKALNASARVVYIELKALFNGYNNGKVMASERVLADMTAFSKNTISRALETLQDAGFIVEMRRGIMGVDGKGIGTLWRLTELGCLGERPTKDFRRWQPKNRIPGPKLTRVGPKLTRKKRRVGPKLTQGGSRMNPGKGLFRPMPGSIMDPI